MLTLLRTRPYRVVLTANFISLFGSGLSHAGVIWFVLEQTQSEKAVALLISLSTMPSLLLLPISGVFIDRNDRRYVAIALDVIRGLTLTAGALLAFAGQLRVWHVNVSSVILGLGAFMFWPNFSALTQEIVEQKDVVPFNAMVMATTQFGWMIAGTAVGFLYNHIGIGGVFSLDAATYAVSALLMYSLRRGKHLVHAGAATATVGAYAREFADGFRYMAGHRLVWMIGAVSAIFTGAMMSQNVLTAPLNMKVLHSGATGFGFCAAGWSLGAVAASGYAGTFLRGGAELRAVSGALLLAAAACLALPYSMVLAVAVALYWVMGVGRGMAGVGIGSVLMHETPKRLMGRVQNVIFFVGILLQLALTLGVGWLSERYSVTAGFFIVGAAYLVAGLLAVAAVRLYHATGPPLPADQPAIPLVEQAEP